VTSTGRALTAGIAAEACRRRDRLPLAVKAGIGPERCWQV